MTPDPASFYPVQACHTFFFQRLFSHGPYNRISVISHFQSGYVGIKALVYCMQARFLWDSVQATFWQWLVLPALSGLRNSLRLFFLLLVYTFKTRGQDLTSRSSKKKSRTAFNRRLHCNTPVSVSAKDCLHRYYIHFWLSITNKQIVINVSWCLFFCLLMFCAAVH